MSFPVWTPGVLTDVIPTSIPASSRKARAASRDQGGGSIPPTGLPPSFVAVKKKSGSMWW